MTLGLVPGIDHSFDPDDIAILVSAYENALRELRSINREDLMARLRDAAVKALRLEP